MEGQHNLLLPPIILAVSQMHILSFLQDALLHRCLHFSTMKNRRWHR